jgi:hypothetical protein
MVFTTSPFHRLISYGVGDLVHSLSVEKTAALSPYMNVASHRPKVLKRTLFLLG